MDKLPEQDAVHTVMADESRKSASIAEEAGAVLTYQTGDSENPLFIPDLQYTREEEGRVIRILDTRLFPWILLTTFVLNMDRTNISNAVSDNLPADLGFTINTVNTAIAIYSVIFSICCLLGAVVAKIIGPSRCMHPYHIF